MTAPRAIANIMAPRARRHRGMRQISHVLRAVRKHLRMDVAFLSEFRDGRRVFRFVDAEARHPPVAVGASDPLEESYCQRVADGRLPQLIHNAQDLPEAAALPVTSTLPVGAHISVPIRLSNGSIFGTLCCFSSLPDHTLTVRDVEIMQLFSDIAASVIESAIKRGQRHKAVRRRIERVLAGSGLSSVYQAIFELNNPRKIVGYECLSRFSNPANLPPNRWFADAEDVGLSVELELQAVRTGLAGLWQLDPATYLSLNVSPKTLMRRELADVLCEYPLTRIVLEITEHASIQDYGAVESALAELRGAGVRIAVDDAGAGIASLRHILLLRPSIIKLDRSLIESIDQDSTRCALVRGLVRFAGETGQQVVAEGVETPAELTALEGLGVPFGQGYLLGRPAPLAAGSVAPCNPQAAVSRSHAR